MCTLKCRQLVFSGHAVQRMFERGITQEAIRTVIRTGQEIASYPDDRPFPSSILLGFVDGRPHHLVLALDSATETCHIITVYIPDPALWSSDFKTRRPS